MIIYLKFRHKVQYKGFHHLIYGKVYILCLYSDNFAYSTLTFEGLAMPNNGNGRIGTNICQDKGKGRSRISWPGFICFVHWAK